MWFWLFVIILAISVGLIVVGKMEWNSRKNKFLYYNDDNIALVGWIASIISGIVVLIMLICIIDSHTNVEANLEKNRETYDALMYKMESTTCRDEFGFLSKEIIDEVQDWNEDVRYYKSAQDDFWVGIFHPNVYDEFEIIKYNTYNNGN